MSCKSFKNREALEVWRDRIEAQGKSGQTVSVFCQEQRLTKSAFYSWKQRLKNPQAPVSATPSRFVAVSFPPPVSGRHFRIELPNGIRIEPGEGIGSEAVRSFLFEMCGVQVPRAEVSDARR